MTRICVSNTMKRKFYINKKILRQQKIQAIHMVTKKPSKIQGRSNSKIIIIKISKRKRIFINFTQRLIRDKSLKTIKKVEIQANTVVTSLATNNKEDLTQEKVVTKKTNTHLTKRIQASRTLELKITHTRVILIIMLEQTMLSKMSMRLKKSKSFTEIISKTIKTSRSSKIIGQTSKRVVIRYRRTKKGGMSVPRNLVSMSLKRIPLFIRRIADIPRKT